MEFRIPRGINRVAENKWCPGCGHGIIVRLIAEAIRDLGIEDRIVMVDDVACGAFAKFSLQFNTICSAHGRTIITAAGAKRARPEAIVIAHPGDGSAYSIGIESTIHCALRNENILAIVVNNSVFGMTGGQMSPTSPLNMKTSSSIRGRDPKQSGYPFDIVKTIGSYNIAYLARGSVEDPSQVTKTGMMIKKALKKQLNGDGFCLVEILSPCPTNLNKSPVDALDFIRKSQKEIFPLGEFIDKGDDVK